LSGLAYQRHLISISASQQGPNHHWLNFASWRAQATAAESLQLSTQATLGRLIWSLLLLLMDKRVRLRQVDPMVSHRVLFWTPCGLSPHSLKSALPRSRTLIIKQNILHVFHLRCLFGFPCAMLALNTLNAIKRSPLKFQSFSRLIGSSAW
jgi:hypothetical protein